MLTRVIIGAGVLCLMLSTVTFAQGFSQGDRVVTLNGSGSSDDDLNNTNFSIQGTYSYFFTDNLEGAVRQDFGFTDLPGSDDTWVGSTRVALDYNWDMGRWWPLLGVNFGYVSGDAVDNTWVAGPEGGVRYFVNPTTFIIGMIEYQIFFDSSDDVFDDGRFVYTVGIGFRWQ
jgi:hypothetical protein